MSYGTAATWKGEQVRAISVVLHPYGPGNGLNTTAGLEVTAFVRDEGDSDTLVGITLLNGKVTLAAGELPEDFVRAIEDEAGQLSIDARAAHARKMPRAVAVTDKAREVGR